MSDRDSVAAKEMSRKMTINIKKFAKLLWEYWDSTYDELKPPSIKSVDGFVKQVEASKCNFLYLTKENIPTIVYHSNLLENSHIKALVKFCEENNLNIQISGSEEGRERGLIQVLMDPDDSWDYGSWR
nr:hypothetical protein [Candidatus Sigynarchaeum springense]